MLQEKRKVVEDVLQGAYKSGFSNAAASLSMMTKDKIDFGNLTMGLHKLDSDYFSEKSSFSHTGSSLLVTTEVFGDISGKSYLFLSEKEFELLTSTIPSNHHADVDLKEEFIKELDNILSASVITKLSNTLQYKMYGDVPVMVGKVQGKIEDIIYDDFNDQAEEVYISSMMFSFEGHPAMRPCFIWVMDSNSMNVSKE